MKRFYNNPLAEILYLDAEDIITSSPINDTENPDGDDDTGGWGEIFPVYNTKKRKQD